MRRELAANPEQLPLESEDERVQRRLRPVRDRADGCSGEAEGRDRFIGRAVGVRPKVALADAGAAEEKAGGAGIALAGLDAHRGDASARSAIASPQYSWCCISTADRAPVALQHVTC